MLLPLLLHAYRTSHWWLKEWRNGRRRRNSNAEKRDKRTVCAHHHHYHHFHSYPCVLVLFFCDSHAHARAAQMLEEMEELNKEMEELAKSEAEVVAAEAEAEGVAAKPKLGTGTAVAAGISGSVDKNVDNAGKADV